MLLVALGYDADIEGYVGANWAINVASDALTAGVYDPAIPLSNVACTREQAAQLAFKALTAAKVEYTGGTTITIGDSTIRTGATLKTVQGSTAANGNYDDAPNGDGVMQFCEQHFKGLKKATVAQDDFGRPGTVEWRNNGILIASVLPVPTKTYTEAVTSAQIFADLGLTANIEDVTVYTDGKFNVENTFDVQYNNNTDKLGGNGTLTEVYYKPSGTPAITIVVINTYLGSITAVSEATAVSKASVTVTKGNVAVPDFDSGTFYTTGFAVNDKVLYTVAETANNVFVVKSVTAPTKLTLTATSYVANTSFVAGGETYTYSAKFDGVKLSDFNAHDVYLDSYGYVIDITGATTTTNYAVVLAAGESSDGFGGETFNIKLLKTDGTQVVATAAASATDLVGNIVTYTINAVTGVYTLDNAPSTDYTDEQHENLALSLTQGKSAFNWTDDDDTTTFYGNANTVYLVANPDNTYSAYTGFASVPSMTGAAVGQVVVENGFAKVVYIKGATTASTASGTVYLTGAYTTTVDVVKGTYYTSNAIVNGTITTVDLADTPTEGLYTGITYNAHGIGTIGSPASVSTAVGTKAAASGVIGLGTAYYSYTSDCAVYYISTAGVPTASSIAGLKTDANDTVIFTTNPSGAVTAIYVQVVA
jgi:hypothetical protein